MKNLICIFMFAFLFSQLLSQVVIDIDGNVYKTIKIGDQVWMAENLKTTKYNEGTSIPEVTESTAWSNHTTPGYCWYDNDSTMNANLFGVLYNFYTIADTNSLNVCPVGWDVPTDVEWRELNVFVEVYGYRGSRSYIAKSLAATFRWNNDATDGNVGNDLGSNNSSGFAGLPGGGRNSSGIFYDIGDNGGWWSSIEYDTTNAWAQGLVYNGFNAQRSNGNKRTGLSVRCLRD